MRILACYVALITLGGLAPPRASSQPYRLICSYFDEPRAAVLSMDEGGSVTVEQNLSVETDPVQVTVSPDGRAFVVSQYWYAVSDLPPGEQPPWFFLLPDGTIQQAADGPRPGAPSVFSPDGRFCFSGASPCRTLELDYVNDKVNRTKYSAAPNQSVGIDSLGYSQFAYALLWVGDVNGPAQSIPVLPLGELGEPSNLFFFTGGSNEGMDVSPDGRFVAIIGIDRPQLTIVGLDPSGTFRLVQSLTFGYQNSQRIRYTPDGRRLLMLFTDTNFLVSMAVNPVTGEVTEVDHATRNADDLDGYIIDALAITPDSKYVVTLSGNHVTNEQTFLVFRLEENGHLTRITQTRHDWPGYVSDMDFIPPYREPVTAASTGWMFYQ